jgi:methylmalonyl-CoA/ethylmalonyl-CoA epimerase
MTEPASSAPLQHGTLSQVGMVVRNADRTARKLADLLGVTVPEPIFTDTVDKAHTEFRGHPTPARAKLIIFNLGPVAIEVIEPIGSPSTWSEFLEAHGEGVHHIAFNVQDTAQTAKALSAHGISAIQSGVFDGGKYIYSDGEKELGVVLELLEFNSTGK